MGLDRLKVLLFLAVILFLVFQGCKSTTSNIKSGGLKEKSASVDEGEIKEFEEEGVPKVSEFILGPGDKVEIIVYRNDSLNRTIQIDHSGKIMYPLTGDIYAAGLSIFQLRDKIRDGLSRYIVDPQVSIGVLSMQSQKIIVLGEVKNPGFFQAESPMTLLDAISRAGGITLDGKQKSVLLIRGGMKKPELTMLNLEKALKEGDLTQNIMLQRGDIVYVPRTVIANVERFFGHISAVISPIVTMESGYFIGQRISEGGGTGTAIGTQ
ncbi:MAG: polysaccharide export protein [Candidatus Omnitrophica bacterium]|nr:polysaccharide export protein [Candidatus Omnitrophota bacterium]